MNKKVKRILFLLSLVLLISTVVVSLYLIYYKSLRDNYYEKSSFTEDEIKVISKVVDYELNDKNIKKIIYTHSKDTVFLIYVFDMQINTTNSSYTLISEDSVGSDIEGNAVRGSEYKNKNNKLFCFNYYDNGKYITYFTLYDYNDELYKIITE